MVKDLIRRVEAPVAHDHPELARVADERHHLEEHDRCPGMVDRFCTTLDCLDVGFQLDNTLDQLPQPSQIGATRVGGIDLNKPRIRATLTAVLALAAAPAGFTVADLATRVHTITGNTDYTVRHAAYDLRKLRGKETHHPNPAAPATTTYYHQQLAPSQPSWDHVIAPILAGVRSPWTGRKPTHWTMQILFHDLGLTTSAAAA